MSGLSVGGILRLGRGRSLAVASGGVGPASVAPEAWFKANAITGLADGAAVATWPDSSGNGRDATQATAGNRPLWKATGLGGQPAVLFDGTDDMLDSTQSAALKPFTVVSVVNPTDRLAAYCFVGATASGGIILFVESSAGFVRVHKSGVTVIVPSGSAGVASGGNAVVTVTYSGTGVCVVRINGTQVATATVDVTFSASSLRLGREITSNPFKGHVAEVLIYASVLAAGDITAAEAYAGTKYGIAIA